MHGTHKLIAKILQHTKKWPFCWSDKNISITLIHSHWMAIVLATVIFQFDKEKRDQCNWLNSHVLNFKKFLWHTNWKSLDYGIVQTNVHMRWTCLLTWLALFWYSLCFGGLQLHLQCLQDMSVLVSWASITTYLKLWLKTTRVSLEVLQAKIPNSWF